MPRQRIFSSSLSPSHCRRWRHRGLPSSSSLLLPPPLFFPPPSIHSCPNQKNRPPKNPTTATQKPTADPLYSRKRRTKPPTAPVRPSPACPRSSLSDSMTDLAGFDRSDKPTRWGAWCAVSGCGGGWLWGFFVADFSGLGKIERKKEEERREEEEGRRKKGGKKKRGGRRWHHRSAVRRGKRERGRKRYADVVAKWLPHGFHDSTRQNIPGIFCHVRFFVWQGPD